MIILVSSPQRVHERKDNAQTSASGWQLSPNPQTHLPGNLMIVFTADPKLSPLTISGPNPAGAPRCRRTHTSGSLRW